MRVIAGTLGGRKLESPDGVSIRPTSDRVREAVFNTLFGMIDIEGARVVDLFSGSGALGIEALSRGAGHCTFVDDAAASVRLIRANLTGLGLADRSDVVQADAITWARRAGRADVVLADPPYGYGAIGDLADAVEADLLVVESGGPIELGERWRVAKDRTYGTTVVVYARRVTNG